MSDKCWLPLDLYGRDYIVNIRNNSCFISETVLTLLPQPSITAVPQGNPRPEVQRQWPPCWLHCFDLPWMEGARAGGARSECSCCSFCLCHIRYYVTWGTCLLKSLTSLKLCDLPFFQQRCSTASDVKIRNILKYVRLYGSETDSQDHYSSYCVHKKASQVIPHARNMLCNAIEILNSPLQ